MISILLVHALMSVPAATPVFESKYTSTGLEACKGREGDEDSPGEPATDCPGLGRYEVTENYAAVSIWHAITSRDRPEFSLSLLPQAGLGDNVSSGKIEWRLHGGQPFAVIHRVKSCDSEVRTRCKEFLMVRGLRGHEGITADVDASKPDANATARKIADDGF